MAFIKFNVSGNPQYGGYLTIDGVTVSVTDDKVFQIKDGHHNFILHEKSAMSRFGGKLSKFSANLSTNSSSSLERRWSKYENNKADAAIGDTYVFSADLTPNDCVVITVETQEERFIDEPSYHCYDLSEEAFATLTHQASFLRTISTATKRMQTWSIILLFVGIFSIFSGFANLFAGNPEGWPVLAVALGLSVIGALMLKNAIKRKKCDA